MQTPTTQRHVVPPFRASRRGIWGNSSRAARADRGIDGPASVIFRSGLALALLALGSVGCGSDFIGDGAGGTGASGSSGAAPTGSSSTGIDPGCVPTETTGPKDDTCGIFVDPLGGSDENPGTIASPKKTLGNAVSVWAAGKGIYAATGVLTDTTGVTLPAGVELYGGLDSASGYKLGAATAKTTLAPAVGEIPLVLDGGSARTELHRLGVTAQAALTTGASALGIIVGEVDATLESVDITAGDGVDGQDSATPTDNVGPGDPNDASIVGNNGAAANTTMTSTKNPGGVAKSNPLCSSVGGSGGDGGEVVPGAPATPQAGVTGSPGSATPAPTMGVNDGHGGIGDSGGGCMDGGLGRNGDPVTDGDGGTTLGTLSLTGYHGASGAPGEDGKPGQGGGGGGGAKGKTLPDTRGASAGSGGAGGCGGKGAPGGGAGGSSIALVLLGSTAPTLTNVTLHAGTGGAGGDGAVGEFGGVGGNGGAKGLGSGGTAAACNGGGGGQGSNGGSSGGGHGGHSLGIAYVTSAPSTGFTVDKKDGGTAGVTSGSGAPAEAGATVDTKQLGAE